MEKRRRARINHCLNELKSLILEAMKKDVEDGEWMGSAAEAIFGTRAKDSLVQMLA